MTTIQDGAAPALDVTIVPRESERLLQTVTDPRQRLMLENFRRHSMFEVAGRWKEILDPAMTVEHPVYRVSMGAHSELHDGWDAVGAFYGGMTEAGLNVLFPLWERMAVADWGICFESLLSHTIPGPAMAAMGLEAPDPAATYLLTQRVSNVWPYSAEEKPRLMGEHVYIDTTSIEVYRLQPHEVITPQQAHDALSPLVDALPSYASL